MRQKLSREERRTRSHRLIGQGAVLESIAPEADLVQKLFGGVVFLLPLVIAFGIICGLIRKNSSDI